MSPGGGGGGAAWGEPGPQEVGGGDGADQGLIMLRLGEFFEQGFKLQPEKDPKALDVSTPASARHTLFRLAPLLYRRRP